MNKVFMSELAPGALHEFLAHFCAVSVDPKVKSYADLDDGQLFLTHVERLWENEGSSGRPEVPLTERRSVKDANSYLTTTGSFDNWSRASRLLGKLWALKSPHLSPPAEFVPSSMTGSTATSAILSLLYYLYLSRADPVTDLQESQVIWSSQAPDFMSLYQKVVCEITRVTLLSQDGLLNRSVQTHLGANEQLLAQKQDLSKLLERFQEDKIRMQQTNDKLVMDREVDRKAMAELADRLKGFEDGGIDEEDLDSFQHAKDEYDRLARMIPELQEAIRKLEAENRKLQKEKFDSATKLSFYKEEVDKLLPLRDAVNLLEPMLAGYSSQVDETEKKNGVLMKEIWALMGQVDSFERERAADNSEKARAVKENLLLTCQLDYLRSSLDHFTKGLEGSRVGVECRELVDNLKRLGKAARDDVAEEGTAVCQKLERRNFGKVVNQLASEIQALWWVVRELGILQVISKDRS